MVWYTFSNYISDCLQILPDRQSNMKNRKPRKQQHTINCLLKKNICAHSSYQELYKIINANKEAVACSPEEDFFKKYWNSHGSKCINDLSLFSVLQTREPRRKKICSVNITGNNWENLPFKKGVLDYHSPLMYISINVYVNWCYGNLGKYIKNKYHSVILEVLMPGQWVWSQKLHFCKNESNGSL